MDYTEYYNLAKPEVATDLADVEVLNSNMDTIDQALYDLAHPESGYFDNIHISQTGYLNEATFSGDVSFSSDVSFSGDVSFSENVVISGYIDHDMVFRTGYYPTVNNMNVVGVEANPADSPTDTLTSVNIGGTVYDISGGSSVTPNPQGEPTDTLSTIEIDGTIYDIEGSGGGGGGILDEIIFTDTAGTTGSRNITLTKSLNNFDAIYFEWFGTSEEQYTASHVSPVYPIEANDDGNVSVICYPTYGNRYIVLTGDPTSTSVSLQSGTWDTVPLSVYKIHGVKFSGGGTDEGSFYKETTLWSGSDSASMTLSESFENYDAIMLIGKNTYNNIDYSISGIWLTSYLKTHINDGMRFGLANDSWYVYFSITDNTTFIRQDQYSVYISEIKGLKFGGGKSARIDLLWDYVNDNSGSIYWSGSALTLNGDIRNYDEVVVEIVSAQGDVSDQWKSSYQWRLLVDPLINSFEPGTFTMCSYDQRSAKFQFTNTTLQKLLGNGSENGVIRVYGVTYGGAGNSGGYSETSLYTYTGSTRQTTLSLSDAYTDYDAIEFTFGWNLGGDEFETVNVISSSKIVSNVFVNVGGEGRYNYVSRGSTDNEIILATATGSWDGSSIIREVRGINY